MAFVVHSDGTRRGFIRTIGGGVLLAGLHLPGATTGSVKWALLSDTHIPTDPANEYRGFKPRENLEKVIPEVIRFAPDGVLIDGDLAREEGLASDYSVLKSLLEPIAAHTPIALALGNHDDRDNFISAFALEASGERAQLNQKCVSIVDLASLRMIMLDSLAFPHQVPGYLGKQQREWLDGYLDSASKLPTLLFVHHTLDDGDNSLLDFERLLAIAHKHSQVKAVFYGHSHIYKSESIRGLHLVNLPAVGYNFRDSASVGWVQAVFTNDGVQLTLQAIGGDTSEHGKTRSLAWR